MLTTCMFVFLEEAWDEEFRAVFCTLFCLFGLLKAPEAAAIISPNIVKRIRIKMIATNIFVLDFPMGFGEAGTE